MLNRDYVFDCFRTLSGLTAAEAERWRPLCDAHARGLESRLRDGVDVAAEADRLAMAAAGTACEAWLGFASPHEIKVGDISVKGATPRPSESGPLEAVADLLRPEGFAFLSTPEAQP